MSAISLTAPLVPALKAAPAAAKTRTIAVSVKDHAVRFFHAVVLNPDTPQWLGNLGSIARSVEQLASPFFALSEKAHKILGGSQLFALYNAPFNLKEVMFGIKNMIQAKTLEERVDEGLEMVTNFGQLTEDIGGIAGGLQELKFISSSLAWLSPLAIFAAAASTINYYIDGKAIFHCSKLLKKMKVKYLNDPKALIAKHGYHLRKQGNVTIASCEEILGKIDRAGDNKEAVEKKLSKAIREKIRFRRISQALSIVVTTISLIATAIFLLTSAQAFLIAGAALVIALSVIAMARRGMNVYSNYKFEKRVEKIKVVLS